MQHEAEARSTSASLGVAIVIGVLDQLKHEMTLELIQVLREALDGSAEGSAYVHRTITHHCRCDIQIDTNEPRSPNPCDDIFSLRASPKRPKQSQRIVPRASDRNIHGEVRGRGHRHSNRHAPSIHQVEVTGVDLPTLLLHTAKLSLQLCDAFLILPLDSSPIVLGIP